MPEEQLPETMNAVTAVNLALRGTEGPVYGPLTFTAPASGLTVLSGRGGSGRTAWLSHWRAEWQAQRARSPFWERRSDQKSARWWPSLAWSRLMPWIGT